MSVKELLIGEVEGELQLLSEVKDEDVGKEYYNGVTNGVTKLMDRLILIEQNEASNDEKAKTREADTELKNKQIDLEHEFKSEQLRMEREFKEKQLEMEREFKTKQLELEKQDKLREYELKVAQAKDESKDRKVKNVITVVTFGVGTVVTIIGAKATFEFEREGTVTSLLGKGFLNRLLPKK